MAKAKFERNKPHCNIGTIGHVDHGKTCLLYTSMCIRDRYSEIKTPNVYNKNVTCQLRK